MKNNKDKFEGVLIQNEKKHGFWNIEIEDKDTKQKVDGIDKLGNYCKDRDITNMSELLSEIMAQNNNYQTNIDAVSQHGKNTEKTFKDCEEYETLLIDEVVNGVSADKFEKNKCESFIIRDCAQKYFNNNNMQSFAEIFDCANCNFNKNNNSNDCDLDLDCDADFEK